MLAATSKVKMAEVHAYLEERSALHQMVLRKLFSAIYLQGKDPQKSYNALAAQYGVFAAEINSLREETKALYQSWHEALEERIAQQRAKIARLQEKLKTTKDKANAHQWKRKLHRYQTKLEKCQAELKAGKPHICFGSKKLFHKQFHLQENGCSNHGEWKAQWQEARARTFYLAGRAAERSGNDGAILQITEVGAEAVKGILQLRKKNNELPGCRAKLGTSDYTGLAVEFKHNRQYLLAALEDKRPITYRFRKEEKGWYIDAIVELPEVKKVTDLAKGSIGVDQNPLCIVGADLKPDGNPEALYAYRLSPGRLSQGQAQHELSHIVCELVALAVATQRPLVIEKLDFAQLQRELTARGLNRLLGRFKYSLFRKLLYAKAAKAGVEVIEVNPAYSSLIGWFKFGVGYGLNRHEAAAIAIGRRVSRPQGKTFSERLRARRGQTDPLGALLPRNPSPKPARKRAEHAWRAWRRLGNLLAKRPAGSRRKAGRRGKQPLSGGTTLPPDQSSLCVGSTNRPQASRGTIHAPAPPLQNR